MRDRPLAGRVDDADRNPEQADFDRCAAYEDGSALVICDRTNPRAWIRAATTATLDP